jgi:ABC-2 type transport system permease protein
MSVTLHQVAIVARRSLKHTIRQPFLLVPPVVFPLILMAVNSGGLRAATRLPGFPTDNYLNFALAVTFMQGALFAGITAGTQVATDVESGFLNRLQLTPLRGIAILVGQLAGAILVAVLGALVYLGVGLVSGAHIEAGVGGAVVLLAFAVVVAIAFGGLGGFLGARTGQAQAVQGMFPLFFVTLFLSSMALPRDLIQTDWFRTIATYNPISYLLDGIRSLLIDGWDAHALALGFGVAVAVVAVGLSAATLALRHRLVRT